MTRSVEADTRVTGVCPASDPVTRTDIAFPLWVAVSGRVADVAPVSSAPSASHWNAKRVPVLHPVALAVSVVPATADPVMRGVVVVGIGAGAAAAVGSMAGESLPGVGVGEAVRVGDGVDVAVVVAVSGVGVGVGTGIGDPARGAAGGTLSGIDGADVALTSERGSSVGCGPGADDGAESGTGAANAAGAGDKRAATTRAATTEAWGR
ncbi:hypothetical protein [Microbacterium sp. GXS0129]|uniref:hypothetical protein n=1 Tax=Microbacterium sp. GXS0129 TaxID=3377836 RepID=UPI00383AD6E2